MSTQLAERPTVAILWTEEGEPYNADTGEVLWVEEYESLGLPAESLRSPYSIETYADVEMAMDRRQFVESQIDSLTRRRDIMIANYNRMIGQQRRKLDWWSRFCQSQVVEFARQKLEGKKARSFTTPFGTISFRKTQGRTEIRDMEAAIAWMESIDPSKVKIVKSVNVTSIKEVVEVIDDLPFISTTGPGESVSIDCGFGK